MKSYQQSEVTLYRDQETKFVMAEWRIDGHDHPAQSVVLPRPDDIERLRGRVAEDLRDRVGADELRRELGVSIFNAMAPMGDARDALREYIKRFLKGGDGVRIALRCKWDELEMVPWELAYDMALADEMNQGYLALVEGISFVRLGDTTQASSPIGNPGRLQIFFVDGGQALPPSYTQLSGKSMMKVEIEESLIVDQTRNLQNVRWDDVESKLADKRPNVFHFTGHGLAGDDHSDPSLLFTGRDREREVQEVSAHVLGEKLADAGVKLAVLAACYAGVDRFWAGLGAGVLACGVPAVVSMQARLWDEGGDTFARELYLRLARGEGLDEAVARGRSTVHAAARRPNSTDPDDWWLPVVHTRATAGLHFDKTAPSAPGAAALPRARMRLVHTHGAVPMESVEGNAFLWKPERTPLDGGGAITLASDGRSCVLASDGGVVSIGVLGMDQEVNWWASATIAPGSAVMALEVYPFSAELLVRSRYRTQMIQVDAHGRSHIWKEFPGRAVSGAWTGRGFTWTDDLQIVRTDDTHEPFSVPPNGSRSLDAGIGEEQRLVSWLFGRELVMCQSNLTSPYKEEVRSKLLDTAPNRLFVARPIGGEPTTIFVSEGDDLVGWAWDDLEPVSQ